MLLAGACTRPGSNSAPQQFGVAAAGPNVQVLDPRLVLSLPDGVVAPTTISSFVKEFGVKVTVMPSGEGSLTGVGATDIALTDDVTLSRLVSSKLAESIDRSLVANRKLLVPPFDNPPYDPATTTASPRTTSPRASRTPSRRVPKPPSTWRGFFRLAALLPGRVAVPPDRDIVIGAALTAAGHDWNASSSSDLSDAADILLPLRPSLVIVGIADRRRLPTHACRSALLRPGVRRAAGGRPLRRARGRKPRPCAVLLHPGLCARPRLGPRVAQPHARAHRRRRRDALHRPSDAGRPRALPAPTALIANQAVFPPALPPTPLTFANVSASGAQLRTTLWEELTAGRRLRLPAR